MFGAVMAEVSGWADRRTWWTMDGHRGPRYYAQCWNVTKCHSPLSAAYCHRPVQLQYCSSYSLYSHTHSPSQPVQEYRLNAMVNIGNTRATMLSHLQKGAVALTCRPTAFARPQTNHNLDLLTSESTHAEGRPWIMSLRTLQQANDLQGHPRSLEMAQIDRAYDTSYYWCVVTTCLSCTISLILPHLLCMWLPLGGRNLE